METATSYDDLLESRDGWKRGYEAKEAEVERLREALREFARRIERDRREPDKVLIEATSMRAVADDVRAFPNAS
jgi:hypothetical protein